MDEVKMDAVRTEEQEQQKQKRKRKAGILAALLALLLLMSGTFAWFYMTNAINEFGGKRGDLNSAVLHDDFDEKGLEDVSGEVVHDKDIYVENTGANPIYVRIRLDEYMEIDEQSVIPGAEKMKESTWKTHTPDTDDVEDCGREFHDYWEWKLGGDSVEYEPNAFGQNGTVSRYAADGTDTRVPGAAGNEWTYGHTATEVIALTEYMTLNDTQKAAFKGWIMDTDGYAYWYEKLVPEEATGLLLDQVTLKQSFPAGSTYYYAINVVLETVDDDDLEAWLNGTLTKDGMATPDKVKSAAMATCLKEMSSSYVKITAEMNQTTPPAGDYDLDEDGYLSPEERKAYEEAKVLYVTVKKIEVEAYPDKLDYDAGQTFDPTGLILKVTYGDDHTSMASSRYTFDPDGPLEAGTTEVTIWYEGVSTTIGITVD